MSSPLSSWSDAVRWAASELRAVPVPSPEADAGLLAAHAAGVEPGELQRLRIVGAAPTTAQVERLTALVGERQRRVPVQHLVGWAPFRHLTVRVGPGVFVPRPETEEVAGSAIEFARNVLTHQDSVLVADLCTGSGAIALSVAQELSSAQVVAVERDDAAAAWARQNIQLAGEPGARVTLVEGDATSMDALHEWAGHCDVVVSNPPYIPVGAIPREAEVRDHDPEAALYGGSEDGLAIPRRVIEVASQLCRPGGSLVMEHADCQQEALLEYLRISSRWSDEKGHTDLVGRPRYCTARRTGEDRSRS